jgi:fatty-acyl-CoA synthase
MRSRAVMPISTFCDALDYAAQGERGFNFHDPRGTLKRSIRSPNCARCAGGGRRLVARGSSRAIAWP